MGLGQQDSHELFFVLMTSLEEQTAQAAKSRNILALLDKEECGEQLETKEDTNQNESVRIKWDSSMPLFLHFLFFLQLNNVIGGDPSKRSSCYISRAGTQVTTAPSHIKFDFPFRGQQLSQLTCTVCSKSVIIINISKPSKITLVFVSFLVCCPTPGL
jgi:hypothetical protein